MSELLEAVQGYADKLQSLGDADAIALHFQGREVIGGSGHDRCAIAVDLQATLREQGFEVDYVSVGRWLIVGNTAGRWIVSDDVVPVSSMVKTPESGMVFIERYDNGGYPELRGAR